MKIGAVVVNFNGGRDLPVCLEALRTQSVPTQIVLVDCASTDGSRELAECPPSGVVGLPLLANAGYAGGCAAGLAALDAETEVVGFFNPDCFPAADFLAVCGRVIEQDAGVGGVAGRLVRPGGAILDSCGQVLTPLLLRVRDRGYGSPAGDRFCEAARVLAACGAAMVYRRAALAGAAVDGRGLPRRVLRLLGGPGSRVEGEQRGLDGGLRAARRGGAPPRRDGRVRARQAHLPQDARTGGLDPRQPMGHIAQKPPPG